MLIVQSPDANLQKLFSWQVIAMLLILLTVLSSGVFHDYKNSEIQPFSDTGCIGSW